MSKRMNIHSTIVIASILGACATTPSSPPTTQDDVSACGWLSGGDCDGKADGGGPSGDWRSPEFWADLYLAKYATQRAAALANIEPGPPPLAQPRTVLLITGITIRAEWFDPIVARLRRDGFNPVVYEPPALLTGSLFQASQDLAAVVERVRAESGQDKIDILAECTGGVIARHYIQSLGGDQYVSRLVTFVSPQNGIGLVPLVAKVTGWPALYDLSPGSAFLNAVDGMSPPASVPVTSIYTCTDEYIQPYRTSIIPGATNIGLCGHGFVGHFQTFYDPSIYLIMHDALVK
jgi:triacylglycerol esterase/lipase EstA (alpha/beta hydrolase family)